MLLLIPVFNTSMDSASSWSGKEYQLELAAAARFADLDEHGRSREQVVIPRLVVFLFFLRATLK